MRNRHLSVSLLIVSCLICCLGCSPRADYDAEVPAIERAIRASIGWAQEKDVELLYSVVANDEEFFILNPDDSVVDGFEAFKEQVDQVFLDPRFVAVGYEIRNLSIHLSRRGDVAWWSARLDDLNTWDGHPANWIDCRWTGVLEKREGRWVITQMHFSFPR